MNKCIDCGELTVNTWRCNECCEKRKMADARNNRCKNCGAPTSNALYCEMCKHEREAITEAGSSVIDNPPIDESPKPVESDPNGISQHAPGAKLDAGKNRLGLVLKDFAHALWEVGNVGTLGANKYTDSGWTKVEQGEDRYEDAGLRHQFKRWMGEENDPDSEYLHLAHEAWNSLAKFELFLRKRKEQDAQKN